MEERLRFKVWNKRLKKMYDVRSMSYYKNKIVRIEVCEKYKNGESDILIFDEYERMIDECVLLQCTGMKDDNNILIYEGDIVDKGTRCKWIITWFKNRFIIVPDFEYENRNKWANDRVCGFAYFENNHSYADEDDEVIGNIYENADLLKEGKE